MWIERIVAEEIPPHGKCHRGQRHWRSGVAALGGFNGVHRQGTDRVDCQAIEVAAMSGGRGGGRGRSHEKILRRTEIESL